jgi:hypothetical protein
MSLSVRNGLQIRPALPLPAIVPRPKGEDYQGEIRVNQVFAWEPHRPYARELVIVTRIECGHSPQCGPTCTRADRQIWCKNIEDQTATWGPVNDESRFREAVYATQFNDMWIATPDSPTLPLLDLPTILKRP